MRILPAQPAREGLAFLVRPGGSDVGASVAGVARSGAAGGTLLDDDHVSSGVCGDRGALLYFFSMRL